MTKGAMQGQATTIYCSVTMCAYIPFKLNDDIKFQVMTTLNTLPLH